MRNDNGTNSVLISLMTILDAPLSHVANVTYTSVPWSSMIYSFGYGDFIYVAESITKVDVNFDTIQTHLYIPKPVGSSIVSTANFNFV